MFERQCGKDLCREGTSTHTADVELNWLSWNINFDFPRENKFSRYAAFENKWGFNDSRAN